MRIDYEIEFVTPKFAALYGRRAGSITGSRLKSPYAEVRSSMGNWIRDAQKDMGLAVTGGAVPKFRFLLLVVNGECVNTERFPFGLDTEPSGKSSRTA